MIIYAVTQLYYDNGKTTAYMRTYDLDKKPENIFTRDDKCDRYVDYFTNKKQAEKLVDDVRKA